jgi:glycosyltransferase involved in cell wall biosynthesis
MKPRISVIVPSYNKPEYLVECLQSIQAQTFEDWECIVVSDGSPRVDEIRAAVDGMRDPRFRLVEHTENRGLAAARNTGIREARADLVVCVDEDDILRQDCMMVLWGEVIKRGVQIVCPQGRLFDGEDTKRRCSVPSIEEILVRQPLLLAGALIRREVFGEIGEFEESDLIRLGREDHEWYIRAVSCGVRISVIDEELYFIRRPSSGKDLSRSLDLSACRSDFLIYRYITKKHADLYRRYKGAYRAVIRNALLREARSLEGEGRYWRAFFRRWQAVLIARESKDFRAAVRLSLELLLGSGVAGAVLKWIKVAWRPNRSLKYPDFGA